jgi:hypothetical protein
MGFAEENEEKVGRNTPETVPPVQQNEQVHLSFLSCVKIARQVMGCVRVEIPRRVTMTVDVFWGVKPCIMKMEAVGRSELPETASHSTSHTNDFLVCSVGTAAG